jgi:hypothetical protein
MARLSVLSAISGGDMKSIRTGNTALPELIFPLSAITLSDELHLPANGWSGQWNGADGDQG